MSTVPCSPGALPYSTLYLALQVIDETAKMLKRHKQRFLGDLHIDQQKLRAQLEMLRSDVEAFAELGDIGQVRTAACQPKHLVQRFNGQLTLNALSVSS